MHTRLPYSSNYIVFELLNQSYAPLTSSTITTTVNYPPSDLQAKLNDLAENPTNFGRGCGVAMRTAANNIADRAESSSSGFLIFFKRKVMQMEDKLKSYYSQFRP